MHVHLTATLTGGADRAIVLERHPSSLLSFAYEQTERTWKGVWDGLLAQGVPPRIIIDSGAFTAFTLGKAYTPKEYARWALGFGERWGSKAVDLNYMNLDVIGDQAATWRNQRALEKLGLKPMPIVTFGASMKDLRRALDGYDYIALGGLVPYTRQKAKLQGWLDTCFREVLRKSDELGHVPRIHLLGVTTEWVLKRYPMYSSDSSSFIACIRYGSSRNSRLPSIPRYSQGAAQASAAQHALRMEIRNLVRLQNEATAIWTRRGITWPDAP